MDLAAPGRKKKRMAFHACSVSFWEWKVTTDLAISVKRPVSVGQDSDLELGFEGVRLEDVEFFKRDGWGGREVEVLACQVDVLVLNVSWPIFLR